MALLHHFRLFPLLLGFLSFAAFAGGDYAEGTVSAFSEKNGDYLLRFARGPGKVPLINKCDEIVVLVSYRRVPWYSWLPRVQTSHPSLGQTEEAARYLKAAHLAARPVRFGYLGRGLFPASGECQFRSKGLALKQESGTTLVMAFHDPV